MTLIQLVGATVLSAFLALNVLAVYVYKKRRVSLDPRSDLNHGIAERFDTVEELREFHAQEQAAVVALGRPPPCATTAPSRPNWPGWTRCWPGPTGSRSTSSPT